MLPSLRHVLALIVLAVTTSAVAAPLPKPAADLVVYGGTASGVMTAYSGAKQGLHVILLEPTQHVGGMVTGGLSATDYAYFGIIGATPASSTSRQQPPTATRIYYTERTGFPSPKSARPSSTNGSRPHTLRCISENA